jgi:Peptidase family M23
MKNLRLLFVLATLTAGTLTTSAKDRTPVNPSPIALVHPVAGKKSKVGGFFGDYRNGGRSHKGIDIYAKKGTPVVAICDGVITSTANEKLGGKTIRLRASGRSFTAYYAHLDKLHVTPGQYVTKGQTIGTVGNTGNAKRKAPHLHFGILGGGVAVNPLPYVKKATKILNPSMIAVSKKNITKKEVSVAKSTKHSAGTAAYTKPKQAAYRSVMPAPTASAINNASGEKLWKRIRVNQYAPGTYFVTKNMNVVAVDNGNLVTIGKWKELNNGTYPNYIRLQNNMLLYVDRNGSLVTQDGERIGTVN